MDIELYRCEKNMGCVIMASGMAKRFGSNKLMADWAGEPLIMRILASTEGLFAKRVVVTRHKEVEALCLAQGIDVIFHDFPHRNDTVRLGLEYLMKQTGFDMSACMFCQSDQPLLTKDSLKSMIERYQTFSDESDDEGVHEKKRRGVAPEESFYEENQSLSQKRKFKMIRLAYGDEVGTPVIFPVWTFMELMQLPEKKGGGYVLKKYPEYVERVEAGSAYELKDVDTPEELAALRMKYNKRL